MKSRVIARVAAVAAALFTQAAFAAGGAASLAITDARLSVIDLTPTDGAQAGYTLGSGSTELSIWSLAIPPREVTVPFGQAAVIASGYGRLATEVAVGPALGSTTIGYTEQTSGPRGGSFTSTATQEVEVTLKANSLLIMDVTTLAQFGSSPADSDAWGSVWLMLSKDGRPSTTVLDRFANNYTGVKTYQLAFANVLDTNTTLTLSLQSNMFVTAVPEPSAVMMLPLGLAGILALARRRQRAGKV